MGVRKAGRQAAFRFPWPAFRRGAPIKNSAMRPYLGRRIDFRYRGLDRLAGNDVASPPGGGSSGGEQGPTWHALPLHLLSHGSSSYLLGNLGVHASETPVFTLRRITNGDGCLLVDWRGLSIDGGWLFFFFFLMEVLVETSVRGGKGRSGV